MTKTNFVWHELYAWHDNGNYAGFIPSGYPAQPGVHNENPETKRRFKNLLDASGFINNLHVTTPEMCTEEDLLRFHTPDYVKSIEERSALLGGDAGEITAFGHGGYEIAKLSAGGVIGATTDIVAGTYDNAYVLNRPPGHHADADMGRGFCIFGNVVVAAKHAIAKLGLERVAVVDWDVHHGNGTETAFYDDPNVLTISVHQDNWFPVGRGFVDHVGEGAGEGAAINIPLPPGSGVGAYESAFDRVVVPALQAFKPDLIYVASGFDASAYDPLGRMMMHSKGYNSLAKKLVAVAGDVCGGRLVMAHEGGYSPTYVPFCGAAVMEALTGLSCDFEDPYLDFAASMGGQDLQPTQEAVITSVVDMVSRYHKI